MGIMATTATASQALEQTTHQSGAEVKTPQAGIARAVELVSGLGAGLALVLPQGLRGFGVALLVAGIAVHGVGMTLKYRLESRMGPPRRWERALFWLCWACLAGLGIWIASGSMASPEMRPT
jgi:hypothetical protein